MRVTYEFTGQVTLVTGAGSGSGLDTARAFAKAAGPWPRWPTLNRLRCSRRWTSIGHLCRRYRNGVWQTLGVYRDMPLDPRHLLACVIALLTRRVRVLHALRVQDQVRPNGVDVDAITRISEIGHTG